MNWAEVASQIMVVATPIGVFIAGIVWFILKAGFVTKTEWQKEIKAERDKQDEIRRYYEERIDAILKAHKGELDAKDATHKVIVDVLQGKLNQANATLETVNDLMDAILHKLTNIEGGEKLLQEIKALEKDFRKERRRPQS